MSSQPIVSVVLPAYNAAPYIGAAIESILGQSLTDFELIVIDDGSRDRTGIVVDTYAKSDSRVRAYHQENCGLVATLNRGLDLAGGRYIARMDADDISLPQRLERQVAFMEAHPNIGICGSWVKTIGASGGDEWHQPTDDAQIRCHLLFHSALAHPTVVFRREILVRHHLHYDASYPLVNEDYAMWVHAATLTQLANVPLVLLQYRLHESQRGAVGAVTPKEQETSRVHALQLRALGIEPTPDELDLHRKIGRERFEPTKDFVERADIWLQRLRTANQSSNIYAEPIFFTLLSRYWFRICMHAAHVGLWTWHTFQRSPLRVSSYITPKRKAALVVCSLLHRNLR
jgi:glycosyltransferase involved in cell wall biosynthesis